MSRLSRIAGSYVAVFACFASATSEGQAPRFRSPRAVTSQQQHARVASVSDSADSDGGQLARLVRTPDNSGGNTGYALADQQGTVQRYVEPVAGIDLEPYVGDVVIVREDTGRTLTAAQLELPNKSSFEYGPAPPAKQVARSTATRYATPQNRVQTAQFVEESTPTNGEEAVTTDTLDPIPTTETIPSGTPVPNSSSTPMAPTPSWVESSSGRATSPVPIDTYGDPDPVYLDGPYDPAWPSPACRGCQGYGGCQCQQPSPSRWFWFHPYSNCGPTGCAPCARGRFYARAESLAWRFDGMDIPPLVIRGNPVDPDGIPNNGDELINPARVVLGGSEILDEARGGGRLVLGTWLDECGIWGIEWDYFGFDNEGFSFRDGGQAGDDEAVGRPFFAVPPGVDSAEIVFFPNQLQGTVRVDISSEFDSSGIRFRHNLCCVESCQPGCGDTVGCGSCCGSSCRRPGWGTRRIDMTCGLRFARLDEWLAINEDLETLPSPPTTTFLVNDTFATKNDFFGAEIGFIYGWEHCRWSLDLLTRLAIGNTHQEVNVSGFTMIDDERLLEGGLLALPTNIGQYSANELSVMPEFGLNAGYQLTRHFRVTFGYTFLYWSRVVRPGDQIDLDVNPDLIPRDDPPADPAPVNRPRPLMRATDFWAHGINLGLEYRL